MDLLFFFMKSDMEVEWFFHFHSRTVLVNNFRLHAQWSGNKIVFDASYNCKFLV